MPDEPWRWKSGPMTRGQANAIASEDLSLCGCGAPQEALGFVLELLRCYTGTSSDDRESTVCNRSAPFLRNMDVGARYFALYQLDRAGLEEHGSSVPGWLTEKGVAFRAALEEFGVEEIACGVLDYLTGELVEA